MNNENNNGYYQPPMGNMPPQQPQQPQQPPYNMYQPPMMMPPDQTRDVMSVGEYIGMFILSAIPVVNIICWIVWLCSSNTNKNKKNYIKATIILTVITAVLGSIGGALMAVAGVSLLDLCII